MKTIDYRTFLFQLRILHCNQLANKIFQTQISNQKKNNFVLFYVIYQLN